MSGGNLKKKKKTLKASKLESIIAFKKKSIFFDLEYWKYLYVRHCIDVMHVEKNVCENLVGTILDILRKSKDGLSARMDLEEMGIRMELAPQKDGEKTYLHAACYNLPKEEKTNFIGPFES